MPSLWKPTDTQLADYLNSQRHEKLTYPDVGATAGTPPANWTLDHTRIPLGSGEGRFESARRALCDWQQFATGWLEIRPHDAPIAEGTAVVILARTWGLWWQNACRVVYVIDEPGRFGFAYGTLPSHAGAGEERFLVERDASGAVWFDVLAFSRPHSLAAQFGYPVMRRLQKRFGRDATAAFRRAVESDSVG